MDYRRFKDTIYLRLDPGEEIIEQIEKVAKKENIQLAQINGLGALNDFTTGVFDTVEKKFHPIHFEGAYEIVSLTGTVTRQDGEVYLHLHMAAGDKDDQQPAVLPWQVPRQHIAGAKPPRTWRSPQC